MVAILLWIFGLAVSQPLMNSDPNYPCVKSTSYCNAGPCNCAIVQFYYIATTGGVTTIIINVMNICPDPMIYVQYVFSLNFIFVYTEDGTSTMVQGIHTRLSLLLQ